MKKLNTEEFIKRANIIHNNKYDYSSVVYKNQDTKINIICPIHGEFSQRPDHHLANHKCKRCSINNDRFYDAKELFIKRANNKWNNFYNYSKVEYKTARKKVIIICPIHGEFLQSPGSHLNNECMKCSIIKNANNQKDTKEDFIKKAELIHKGVYDYSNVNYINSKIKIEIICKKHGSWLQMPYNHLLGKGCSVCVELFNSKGQKLVEKFFKTHYINFKRQKTFDDCRNPYTNAKLRFDFYIPKHNICVEYDGQQHFKPVSMWGGKIGLLETQNRDAIKNKYCKEKNIPLIRISYKENVFEKLSSLLLTQIIS